MDRISQSTKGTSDMATNSKAFERQEQEKVEYEWGTLWPKYHKEKMNWATGFRTKGDVDILFLSGSTGTDPRDLGRHQSQHRANGRHAKKHRDVSLFSEKERRHVRHARRNV